MGFSDRRRGRWLRAARCLCSLVQFYLVEACFRSKWSILSHLVGDWCEDKSDPTSKVFVRIWELLFEVIDVFVLSNVFNHSLAEHFEEMQLATIRLVLKNGFVPLIIRHVPLPALTRVDYCAIIFELILVAMIFPGSAREQEDIG
ncbi:hypothetical protein [Haladaptatus halobius]|uniref:hypothetical protein n=1 Tax=Haladaptatus halobius TaxID=2884875 RepID=UPI001D0B23E4|nr:hypothetical protein [Haladaptatus halobius]